MNSREGHNDEEGTIVAFLLDQICHQSDGLDGLAYKMEEAKISKNKDCRHDMLVGIALSTIPESMVDQVQSCSHLAQVLASIRWARTLDIYTTNSGCQATQMFSAQKPVN